MASATDVLNRGNIKLRSPLAGVSLLIGAGLAGVIVLIATSPRGATPSPQAIQTETDNTSSDMYTAVQYVKRIGAVYTSPQISTVTLRVFPFVGMSRPDAEILAPNGTLIQVIGAPTVVEQDNGWTIWTWPITVNHDGHIGQSMQDLEIRIHYTLVGGDGTIQVKQQSLPLSVTVEMLDFPQPAYMGMIAIGIILSYLAADGAKIRSRVETNFGEIRRPLVWIVLSLILTPLVYIQFKQATGTLTGDQALVSLLLALPFGAGLDLALGKAAAGRA